MRLHVVKIDLGASGLSFHLTPPSGSRETVRQTTLAFLRERKAQIAVNAHFFVPYPSADSEAFLVGLAASNGQVYSAFEQPAQSYALLRDAPALNIARDNSASIVHRDLGFADGLHIVEPVVLWNAVSGSAQIITGGVATIPRYREGELTPGGPGGYSEDHSWYEVPNARTVAGLSANGKTLYLVTVDRANGSEGLTLPELARLLIADYGVYNAINLDGGGSTTLAMEDPQTGETRIVNNPSGGPDGRAVASSLAVFAKPIAP